MESAFAKKRGSFDKSVITDEQIRWAKVTGAKYPYLLLHYRNVHLKENISKKIANKLTYLLRN